MSQSQGSEYDRLFYPFLFEGGQANAEDVLAQVRHSIFEKCREIVQLRRVTLDGYRDQILAAGQAMARAFAAQATLFAFGNGGSATDAQDLVADLLDPPKPGWKPLPAIALTSDIGVITGIGNDVGFDNVFTRQVIAFGKPGDIAVGFSTSGTSKNVLLAIEQAKKQDMLTIGLAGYDGGRMTQMESLDFCVVSRSDHIPRIQEAHATVYHALLEVIHACREDLDESRTRTRERSAAS